MKKITLILFSAVALTMSSCQKPNGPQTDDTLSEKEIAFRDIIEDYIDHNVVPTYKGMADASISLMENCNAIYDAFTSASLTSEQVKAAGESWKQCRDYWEKSESFLYGAADDYKIDPHIDSWPLDKTQMDQLLGNIRGGQSWSVDFLGYGLLGFHAVEYLLFELSEDGKKSLVHSTDYKKEELIYLSAVAEDLCNYCVYLYASWAGDVDSPYAEILEAAELEPSYDYGWGMKNAGSAGSRYKTYQDAVENLVQGCIDIADEVANVKIGTPNKASNESDRNYIESPYSLNSIVDFVGNIVSISNSYAGVNDSDASLSDYFKKTNPDLDSRILAEIQKTKEAIAAIPEPFALSATSDAADKAIEIGNQLVTLLEEAYSEISK